LFDKESFNKCFINFINFKYYQCRSIFNAKFLSTLFNKERNTKNRRNTKKTYFKFNLKKKNKVSGTIQKIHSGIQCNYLNNYSESFVLGA